MPALFFGRAAHRLPGSTEFLLLATTLLGCSVEAPGTGPQVDTGGSVTEQPPPVPVDSGWTVDVPDDARVQQQDPGLDAAVQDAAMDSAATLDAGQVNPSTDAGAALDAALEAQDALVLQDADSSQQDAAQDTGLSPDATPGTDAGPGCTLDGSFSAEVNFDVQWKGTTLGGVIPVLAAGSGHLRVLVRIDAVQSGAQSGWKLTACGATIPDFAASWLIGELYSVEIPARAWDQPTNPSWPLQWTFDCRTPGCGV